MNKSFEIIIMCTLMLSFLILPYIIIIIILPNPTINTCAKSEQLATGHYVMVDGFKTTEIYGNGNLTDCCCDKPNRPHTCICKKAVWVG